MTARLPMAHDDAALAIVIPVYKHSMLLAEAIDSALQQDAAFAIRIVIINDGCPFAETHATCAAFAMAYPEQVRYIRSPNGGLSAARNAGIDYALAAWPGLRAVYLLDADNRLWPKAMQRAMDTLERNGWRGWVYPDIDMFGYAWSGDFGGAYSKLAHLSNNICEAGSLLSRTLLDKGVRFDDTMKLGYEDWEFWLQAMAAGETGVHGEHFGFQYRKRAESMLSNSDRDHAEIISYMRRKHAKLYKPARLLALEQAEAPRYAIYLEDRHQLHFTTDPAELGPAYDVDAFSQAWWQAFSAPGRYFIPGLLVVTTARVLRALADNRLLHWTFWRLEDMLDSGKQFAFAALARSPEAGLIEIDADDADGRHRHADIAIVASDAFQHAVCDPATSWIESLRNALPAMPVAVLGLRCALPLGWRHYGHAVNDLLTMLLTLRDPELVDHAAKRWLWKDPGVPQRLAARTRVRALAQVQAPLLPLLASGTHKDVAFLLPLSKFGGVEKVAFNLAREMADGGWRVHLLITDSRALRVPAYLGALAISVGFLDAADSGDWNGRAYLGTADDSRNQQPAHERITGLLCAMDLVINAHSAIAHGAMARLRRLGVQTANHLHVIDLTESGRPVGHPYLGLAYEHAYDNFLSCSAQLADWLHGMGVPKAKIVALPNGPGYPLDAASAQTLFDARRFDVGQRPLRVLSIGRLDRQKGLERVCALIDLAKAKGAAIDWRLVGGRVLRDDPAFPDVADMLAQYCLPAVFDDAAMTAHYGWADVLIMPSLWEGLPLTLIEAMRTGCVVLATDVGANDEMITHGTNGLLTEGFDAQQWYSLLTELAAADGPLRRLATHAFAAAGAQTWQRAIENYAQVRLGARAPLPGAAAGGSAALAITGHTHG